MTDEQERVCSAYREGCKAEIEANMDKLCVKQQAFEKLVDERKKMTEQALELAHDILDKRMIAENGVREEMREKSVGFRTDFLSKNEYNAKHEALSAKIDNLAEKTNTLSGKVVLIIIGIPIVMSFFVSILTVFITHILTK